ncbi:hypothetical protein [Bradyrhizobium liaoningense]
MSEIASAVERTRKAFASVSRLEEALARAPENRALQLNLVAMQKAAQRSQEQLFKFSEQVHVEVCNYRLLPESTSSYALPFVSNSLLEYQNLFSQIHDSKKNGPKIYASIGKEAFEESILEFAYSYSGSLGVVLLAQNQKGFFEGRLDQSIDALFQVMDIDSRDAVRDIGKALGTAVVKRIHDWSAANLKGGFAADVRWNKSDGKQVGEVINRRRMESIVEIIEATSDEHIEEISATGVLVGGDLGSRSFHFVVPNGEDYRGRLAKEFSYDGDMTLGNVYVAIIKETSTTTYATQKVERQRELLRLRPLPNVPAPSEL